MGSLWCLVLAKLALNDLFRLTGDPYIRATNFILANSSATATPVAPFDARPFSLSKIPERLVGSRLGGI